MTTVAQLLSHERAELGYVEGTNNHTKYAAMAGHPDHNAWCATFQVAMARSAGLKLGNESAFTPSLYLSMKNKGEGIAHPKAGALGFLYHPELGRIAHVFLVESVRKDGRVVTIEGNTDVAGGRTGGRVMRKIRPTQNVFFVMPAYTKPASPPSSSHAKCETLQKAVRVHVDNVWGDETEKACNAIRSAAKNQFPYGVKFTQKIVGAGEDGVWGAKSKSALKSTIVGVQKALVTISHTTLSIDGNWSSSDEALYQKVRKTFRH